MIRRELPNSTVHTIAECGHWPHMEKPDEFNRLSTTFLRHATVDRSGTADG